MISSKCVVPFDKKISLCTNVTRCFVSSQIPLQPFSMAISLHSLTSFDVIDERHTTPSFTTVYPYETHILSYENSFVKSSIIEHLSMFFDDI